VLKALLEKLTYFNAAKDFGYGAKYYIASYRIMTSRSHRYVIISTEYSVCYEMTRNDEIASAY